MPIIGFSQNSNFKDLNGPYLGQNPPGLKPEVFALGIISSDMNEFSITMSPDGKSFYFTRRIPEEGGNRIMVSYWKEKDWSQPVIAPKAGEYEGMAG